jgi:hypothetical protein
VPQWYKVTKQLPKGNIMGKMDKEAFKSGASGEKAPKGVLSSDMGGERKEKLRGGVAMGKEDNVGADKEFNTGRTAGICYVKEKASYR